MEDLHEAAHQYLNKAGMTIAGFVVLSAVPGEGQYAFVLVRASLGDFTLHLKRVQDPDGWVVVDELEAGDFYEAGGKAEPR